ncbi:MAG: hypothetical protein HKN25_09330 [Pyrinomonadaceae bacterium]|nr:hypothetical protein [Pyrinomonadaceae bacterium]
MDHSRRKFLKQVGALSVLGLTGRAVFSLPTALAAERDFEMLVVGDSLVAGQGLREQDKIYTLTKRWLEREVFGGARKVNIRNKSHSGSRLFLSGKEFKALNDAEKDFADSYHPEVNFSFPSSNTQIVVAKNEYLAEGKTANEIDLIMVSGGLTNIGSAYIVDPFKKNKKLRKRIDQSCNHMMFRFLDHASRTFPNALIAVLGYFPLVSKTSSTGKIYNAILELYGFPRPTKPILNNIFTKQFFKPLHKKMNKRSRIWIEESNKGLETAIDRLNQKHGKEKAVFIKSPITEAQSFGTKNSLLFGMAKKGRAADFMYDVRKVECRKAIESVKDVKLKFNRRRCELAGIAHPNVEGARAYAEVVKKRLQSIYTKQPAEITL